LLQQLQRSVAPIRSSRRGDAVGHAPAGVPVAGAVCPERISWERLVLGRIALRNTISQVLGP
jgi:hypothetical protein